jgi:DNA replication and repair protein RecF
VPARPAFAPTALRLTAFRSYARAELRGLPPAGVIALHGPNGAGKTNLLEAVSLLAPGRGLRRAAAREVQRHAGGAPDTTPWVVWAKVGAESLGVGMDPATGRRRARAQGRAVALTERGIAAVWLTPAMDRLLAGPPSGRRRFLDRLVYALDPAHAARVARYEAALVRRMRLLTSGRRVDAAWLDALEAEMAATGVAVAAARLDFAQRLTRAAGAQPDADFPRATLAYDAGGAFAGLDAGRAALEVEEALAAALAAGRGADAASGRCALGPHRGDMVVTEAATGAPAAQGSTGEQKALLLGIVLAHARLVAAERGAPPVLLLDEVAAHLDPGRRAALFALLTDLGGQVWLTGTESALFAPLAGRARHIAVPGGVCA